MHCSRREVSGRSVENNAVLSLCSTGAGAVVSKYKKPSTSSQLLYRPRSSARLSMEQRPSSVLGAVQIVEGPDGFGNCLRATCCIERGQRVMEEVPLIRGEPLSQLPPISAFAAVAAASPLSNAPEIGGAGWPCKSAFDPHLFGLLLAFIDADVDTQRAVLDSSNIQSEMEQSPSSGLPSAGPSELSCQLAEDELRERGPPWLAEEWPLPAEVAASGLLHGCCGSLRSTRCRLLAGARYIELQASSPIVAMAPTWRCTRIRCVASGSSQR